LVVICEEEIADVALFDASDGVLLRLVFVSIVCPAQLVRSVEMIRPVKSRNDRRG